MLINLEKLIKILKHLELPIKEIFKWYNDKINFNNNINVINLYNFRGGLVC